MQTNTGYPDIDTLALVIAHSQIVVTQAMCEGTEAHTFWPLPAGFDEVDIAILEWVAAEGRRGGRSVSRL
ncbi:MAG TPA: hypothetical protein VMF12_18490 [Xanthobacteraceae bacterium]|nr:hypothetical protein [Xanthobacteraceae bacterium]